MRNERTLRRLAAMLSVHAHARYPHGNFPPGFTPPPLEYAATILAEDRAAPDEKHDVPASRRRRAVSKLAAYGLGRPGVPDASRERITDAIRTIVAGAPAATTAGVVAAAPASVDERVQRIVDRVATATRARGAGLRAAVMAGAEAPSHLERSLSDEYAALTGDTSECWTRLAVSVPAVGETASAWVRVEIARPLEDVRASIDPQSWDECSAFFPANGTYLANPGSGGDYPTSGCVAAEGTPETPGSVYGWPDAAVLFEHFEMGIPGFASWFTNLLDIRTSYWPAGTQGPEDRFAVSYALRRPVCGSVLGVPQRIMVDGGSAVATRNGDGTIVEGSKVIRFRSALVTASTKAMFEVLFDELAAQMGELACCPVTLPS